MDENKVIFCMDISDVQIMNGSKRH